MIILFEVIAGFGFERRKPRFETFVQSNGDYELFQRLRWSLMSKFTMLATLQGCIVV